MTEKVFVDSGPIVALLDARDQHHRWAVETFAAMPETLSTCEAVLNEVTFLLRRWPPAIDAVFLRIEQRTLRIESLAGESKAVHDIIHRYRNVPASYADACLVRLTERFVRSRVLTTDSDFRVYRRNGAHSIPLDAPLT